MDYLFEQLSPERFQQLCQSLLAKEYRDIQCFPVGQPDGGRDATQGQESIAPGSLVFQVKFVRNAQSFDDARDWLLSVVDGELQKVTELAAAGATRYILLTNVAGTAHRHRGSIDRLQSVLDRLSIPAMCWWRDDLNRRLDNAYDLKWAYPELLTGTDVVRLLLEGGIGEDSNRRTAAIRAFITGQHARDAEVKFKQVELQNKLVDLFVDVPIALGHVEPGSPGYEQHERLASAYRSIQLRSVKTSSSSRIGRLMRHDPDDCVGAATLLLDAAGQEKLPMVLLEGGPGQGKSTISQYICQVHRMHLLHSPELNSLPQFHRNCPVRIPLRVDLRDMALWLDHKNPFSTTGRFEGGETWTASLESFLCAQIRFQSGGFDFGIADLTAVAGMSPIVLAFDGLDEVAELKRREIVVDEIRDGVRRLGANAISLQVIVTSRPAAFAHAPRLPRDEFYYLSLSTLTRPLIEEYADKWILTNELEEKEAFDVRRILREKLDAPHMRELARNPMQLAILLSLIHTRGVSLPDQRTALYDSYVELFFNREADKSTIVRDHRALLTEIHQYLAWVLHTQAETGKTSGSIRTADLERVLTRFLNDVGQPTALVGELFTGVAERVLMIVAREEGAYEFEVQPLREYFVAKYLYATAPYSPPGTPRRGVLPDRFDAIARHPYWLNVARFYAGCYDVGELPSLIEGLKGLMKAEHFRFTSHPRILAGMLVSDSVFSQRPKMAQSVVERILNGPGFSILLAKVPARFGGSGVFTLPRDCGRDELIERCFAIVQKSSKDDVIRAALELIAQNHGGVDVSGAWWKGVLSSTGPARTDWLGRGSHLGLLQALPNPKLEQALDDGLLDARRIEVLAGAVGWDWAGRDDRAESVVRSLLSGEVERLSTNPTSLLDQFCCAISPTWLQLYFDDRELGLTLPEPNAETRHGDILDECRAYLDIVRNALTRRESSWYETLEPWIEIVGDLEARFGNSFAVCELANAAAGIRDSGGASGLSPVKLFDPAVPACIRARYARAKSNSVVWWRQQLADISSELDAMFWVRLILDRASNRVIYSLVGELNSVLEGLSQSGWVLLAYAVSRRFGGLPLESRHSELQVDAMPAGLSARTVVALAARSPSARAALVGKYLSGYAGRDHPAQLLIQETAIEALQSGLAGVAEHLGAIERSYRQGVIAQNLTFGTRDVGSEMPQKVAERILRRPSSYPTALVSNAESQMRLHAHARTPPVGELAAANCWFD